MEKCIKYTHTSFCFIENVTQFFKAHNGRQGIAVLGFQTNSVDAIEAQYQKHHPKLIQESVQVYENAKVLQVYAYYTGDSSQNDVDTGTVLRFVQPLLDGDLVDAPDARCLLPGIELVAADFDETSQAAYCDHWVSNGELFLFGFEWLLLRSGSGILTRIFFQST